MRETSFDKANNLNLKKIRKSFKNIPFHLIDPKRKMKKDKNYSEKAHYQ